MENVMDDKKVNTVEMLPNSTVEIICPTIECAEIHANDFVYIEILKDGSCLKINICGRPRVKKIIYGN